MNNSFTQRFQVLLSLLVGGGLLAGCGSYSQITGSWKSPDAPAQRYQNVLVAALTSDVAARQTVESDLVYQLQRRGIRATRSVDVFPASYRGKLPPRAEIIAKIRETGHDAVLTASLLDSGSETRYVPSTVGYSPVGTTTYYNNFYGYYSHWQVRVNELGYYATSSSYFLETNLYDVATEKLRWSAQSESYDPTSLRRFSRAFAKLTLARLAKDGVL